MANDKDKKTTETPHVEIPSAQMLQIDPAMFAKMVADGVSAAFVKMEEMKLKAQEAANDKLKLEAKALAEIQAAQRSPCPHCFQTGKACGYKEWKKTDENGKEVLGENGQPIMLNNDKEVHETISVLTERRSVTKWFQGIKINGVAYLSDWNGTPIKVPRVSMIGAATRRFEANELQIQDGRGEEYDENPHYSGQIGASGPRNTIKATHAWRDS